MDGAGISGADLHRLEAVRCAEDFVSLILEQFLDQIAQADFVLDQQDGFVAALENGAGSGGRFLGRRVERGKIDLKRASLAGLAINPDASLALLDDAVDSREPQAGPLADALGGEEGLKDMI